MFAKDSKTLINSRNSGIIILPSETASSICMSDITEREVPVLENPRFQNTNRVIFDYMILESQIFTFKEITSKMQLTNNEQCSIFTRHSVVSTLDLNLATVNFVKTSSKFLLQNKPGQDQSLQLS